jgi:hypothetical protein
MTTLIVVATGGCDLWIIKLKVMSITTSHSHLGYLQAPVHKGKNVLGRWLDWAAKQDEEYHVGWVGFSIFFMSGVVFPLTLTAILLNGASFGLIIASMISLVLVVVGNIAALPTKYTIPFLFVGILIDIVAIVLSFLLL